MIRSHWTKRAMLIVGVSVILCFAALLIGASSAPASKDVHIQAVAHEQQADAGGRGEATIVVGLYTGAGSVEGLLSGSFKVTEHVVPGGGCDVAKKSVREVANGIYRITVAPPPEKPAAVWKRGRYVIAVTVSSPEGPAVAIVELLVDLDD